MRLVIAAVFINHGMQKWVLWSGEAVPMPATMLTIMKVLAIAEPLAGLALILGLLTRVANIGLILVMGSAIVMKISGGAPLNAWEIDMILLAANVVLLIEGPGKYSIDATMMKKKKK